jgi:hypothetical protein
LIDARRQLAMRLLGNCTTTFDDAKIRRHRISQGAADDIKAPVQFLGLSSVGSNAANAAANSLPGHDRNYPIAEFCAGKLSLCPHKPRARTRTKKHHTAAADC